MTAAAITNVKDIYGKIWGRIYNKKEIEKNYEDTDWDWIFETFEGNLQDLDTELYWENEEINTAEIRSILKGIEQLCDELDDLSKLGDKDSKEGKSQK